MASLRSMSPQGRQPGFVRAEWRASRFAAAASRPWSGLLAVTAAAWAVTAAAAGPVASAAPAPQADVDALVSYETRQVMASGVTRTDTWQERLVRRGQQVWTERVLPPRGREPGHAAEEAGLGHKHLNAETSGRWLRLGAQGRVDLSLVDREHRVIVEVPAAEFATVSFDGRYDAAAALVPPAVVMAMQPEGPVRAGLQWRSERNQGWLHRVLWSQDKQMALRVQSRREDGSVLRTVTVRLLPAAGPQALPWQALGGYTAMRYDEFMD